MEIFQFEQFRAIAECGTMSGAAERLYLSQPTLSYNLKKLESELGCKLFIRASNRLELTPYGELVLERVQALSKDYHDMIAAVEEMKLREEATLHIGCFSPLASSFIMPIVAADLPQSTFDVVDCSTSALRDGIASGRFDVLIATDICRSKTLTWRKLYDERACVSLPRNLALFWDEDDCESSLGQMKFTIESGLAGYSDWYAHILREAHVDEERIDTVPFKEHLLTKDTLSTCNLITSFIMGFARVNEAREIMPIPAAYAHRNVGFLYPADAPEKVISFVDHVTKNADRFLSGNAFIPYFVYPDNSKNLRITSE